MRAMLLAATLLAIGAASPVSAGEWTRGGNGELLSPPVPAVSERLFSPIEEAKDAACPALDEVIAHYQASGSSLKSGNLKVLADGLEQDFANRWRRELHLKKVAVTAILAQPLDLRSFGDGAAFDVVEFDANGCAFSRTIMPAEVFDEILKAAIGVKV